MITMNNKEKILISNTNFLNNYDKENFISVSNNVLNRGNHLSQIDNDSLINQLDYLKSTLEKIQIPYSRDLIIYFNNLSCIDRINNWSYKMISVLNLNNDLVIKPEYLLEASNEIKDTINKIISGNIDSKEFYIKYHANIDSYESLLKQRVINGINEYDNAESLFNKKYMDIEDKSLITSINSDCIKNEIIPFIKNFQNIKSDINTEIDSIRSIIEQTINNINLTILIINKNSDNINNETFKLIANYAYNYIRFIIDTAYTVMYILSSKCYSLERIILSINELYNVIKNEFSDFTGLIEYGIYDKTVTESESKKISDNLLHGNNDIFTETVNDIMTYHNKYILSQVYNDDNIPDINNEEFTSTIANRYDYDRTAFESVNQIYNNINCGLDIIEQGLDNKLLVVNKLIIESGFDKPLNEQYDYIIEMVSDVNEYYDFTSPDIYFNLIGEISNYNENTSIIANNAHEIMSKISDIRESINNMDDKFIKNELNVIIESVEDQFISINSNIATNSYKRLKMLGNKADYVLNGYNESTDYPDILIGDINDDFYKECFLNSCLEELHDNNDILMESMLKGYYSEREYLEKGIRIIFEKDGDNGNNSNGTNNTNQSQSSGTNNNTSSPSVNTNTSAGVVSDQNTNNAQNFEKLSVKIKKLIEKIINAFRDFINKFKKKNLEWLNKHKSELINRSYSNVSINVLPYHIEMPESQIFNHYSTMEKNVENVAKNINKINSREDMRSKLFNFGNIKFEGENVDESKVLTNFFKVGNKPLNVATYSNKEVKTLVVDTMIPYCERYYNNLADEVAKYSEKLVAITSKYDTNNATTQTQTESVMIIEEGQENNQSNNSTQQPSQTNSSNSQVSTSTNQNNKKEDKTPKYSEQYKWLSGFITDFVGSVCNATRARNDDYIKILAALVPKKQIFKNREGMDDNAQQSVSADNTK